MKFLRTYAPAVLAFDVLFLLFACISVLHMTQKASLPESLAPYTNLEVDGNAVEDADEAEFLASYHRIGDLVRVVRAGTPGTAAVRLVPYYGMPYIVVSAFIVLLLAGVGILVTIYRPGDRASLVFHMASLAAAASLIGTKTLATVSPAWLGAASCFLFFLAFTLTGVLFLHFTMVFPSLKPRWERNILPAFYALGTVVAFWYGWQYLGSVSERSVPLFGALGGVSRLQGAFLGVSLVAGLATFVHSYRASETVAERKKIRWILFGLSVGPAPFVLFWVLPQALGYLPLVPEIVITLFLLLVPVTFAVSILKYRAMDIDLLINRSTVYAIVVGGGLALYVAIVGAAARAVMDMTAQTSLIVSAATAAALAILFEPARRRVQRWVDGTFYQVQYDFRESLKNILDALRQCLDMNQIAELLVRRTDELLPAERIGFYRVHGPPCRLQLLAHRNFQALESQGVRYEIERLSLQTPVAPADEVEPGSRCLAGDPGLSRRWGVALLVPLLSEKLEARGLLVLGKKMSGTRYTGEDIDLLMTIAAQAGSGLERIALQQKLLVEQAEAQRLEELNRMKSYFVSSVSHDLKTPLSSIRMFAELLRTKKRLSPGETREYLEIIEGESERLSRLINNVLDFAKVERGEKEYSPEVVDLNGIARGVLRMMRYQLAMEKFRVHSALQPGKCFIHADPDAVTEALVNLVGNALKYSPDTREITITTFARDGEVGVAVGDRGIGIPREEVDRIFQPFYRAAGRGGGAGLGLSIVKHIMDAHGGRISVESAPGKGSMFTLLFPRPVAQGAARQKPRSAEER